MNEKSIQEFLWRFSVKKKEEQVEKKLTKKSHVQIPEQLDFVVGQVTTNYKNCGWGRFFKAKLIDFVWWWLAAEMRIFFRLFRVRTEAVSSLIYDNCTDFSTPRQCTAGKYALLDSTFFPTVRPTRA